MITGKQDRLFRRPFSVTILAIGVLMVSISQLVRLTQAIYQREFLNTLAPGLALYLSLSSFIFLVGWCVVWLGLWRSLRWAPGVTRFVSLTYITFIWVDRFLIKNTGSRDANTLFILVVHILLILGVFWILARNKASFYWR